MFLKYIRLRTKIICDWLKEEYPDLTAAGRASMPEELENIRKNKDRQNVEINATAAFAPSKLFLDLTIHVLRSNCEASYHDIYTINQCFRPKNKHKIKILETLSSLYPKEVLKAVVSWSTTFSCL